MNIVMLLDNCFDPDVRVYKEAVYLVKQGNNVQIICLDKKNKYIDKQDEIKDGIYIHRIFCRNDKITRLLENKFFSYFTAPFYAYWLIMFFIRAKRYLKHKRVDILHCHDVVMSYGSRWFFKKQIKVFDMHEYYLKDDKSFKDLIMKYIVSSAQNHSKWIIYVNEKQILNLKEKNRNKLVLLPNYPSQSIFADVTKTTSDRLRIGYVGAVRDFKSLAALIDINDIMKDKFDIKIYGYGSAYDSLIEYERSKGYSSILTGSYNGISEIENIYKNIDILYCVYDNHIANWKYSYPVKFYESILTKTPIIVSKDSTVGDFTEARNIGYTLNLDDKDAFLRLLTEEINNQSYKTKQINLEKIQYHYTWENQVQRLNVIYEKS